MTKSIFIFLLSFLIVNTNFGQTTSAKKEINYGPNISLGYSLYNGFFGESSFSPFADLGGFVNFQVSERFRYNVGLNLSVFGEHSFIYDDLFVDFPDLSFPDTISVRAGEFKYKIGMISIPIRGEYYISKGKKVGILLGAIPRFKLYDELNYEYRNIVKNQNANLIISEGDLINESPELIFFQLDYFHTGFLFKFNRLKIAAIANAGTFRFSNIEYFSERGHIDFSLEFSWRINKN